MGSGSRRRTPGRSRQQENRRRRRQLELIAQAIIAASEAGPASAGAPILASSLLQILPLASFAAGQAAAERIALEVARLVLFRSEAPSLGTGQASTYLSRVAEEQLMYRAAYARAAARRLCDASFAKAGGASLEEAIAREQGYFAAHERRNARRGQRARDVDDAMRLYGDVLGWYAMIRPTSRPHHRAAHRHNWQPMLGTPLQTGGLPGELEHCLCAAGPPISGARLLR